MIIYGTFENIHNDTIEVEINNSTIQGEQIEIGEDGLFFSGDPIQIETNNDDTFEHIIRKSATINLVTNSYVGNLFFAEQARSVSVEIRKNNQCIFFGYVDPNTYTQPYTSPLDEFSINCIDCLSTFKYYNYKDTTIRDYDTNKQSSAIISFRDIIDDMFYGDLLQGSMYYDKSKGLTSGTTHLIFENLGIAENFLYGEDFEKIFTQEKVLEEILRYLNLHIIQEGFDYYIFDWNTIKNARDTWYNLTTNTNVFKTPTTITLTSQMHSDNNTNISIADVYNQIQVKDNLQGQDTVIVSPLEKTDLTSLWTGKQLYMTEYIAEGSGDHAHTAIEALIHGNDTNYDGASRVDWYIQAMNNPNWKCYINGNKTLVETIAEQQNGRYVNQWKIAKYLKEHPCVPYIFKLGSVEPDVSRQDNSPISKISMTPYLYISVNGNENDVENQQQPSDNTLNSLQPILEYVGSNSGGAYSPVDDETINYLVFSGKVLLQPIAYESSTDVATRTNNFQQCYINGVDKDEGATAVVPRYDDIPYPLVANNLVKSDNNDEGRYYVRKFYSIVNPSDTEPFPYLQDGSCGIQPWTKDKSAHGYEYHYSAKGNGDDLFSKLPILECELIIGNKRLIETDMDEYGNSTFQWVTIGQEPTETIDGVVYPITTFSLGVNPAIGDYVIGQEFDIQNTINYQMNVDAEGTAIPIRQSDALSGAVIFRILGPVNTLWNNITRRHPTWFRHTRWDSDCHFILAHTENIILKDFECKIYSNNGGYELTKEQDLIYLSDETDRFIKTKDNITFNFITQLSGKEAYDKGISTGVNLNAVINLTTNLPLQNIYNATTNESAKAEEHYIDQYYTEYSTPKIEMDTQLHEATNINLFNKYHSVPLNKDFYVVGMGLDVRMDNRNIKLKEI